MTSVKLFADKNGLYGFEISGHSSNNCDDMEGKLVCAAVSSAAYMAANTVIEIIGDKYSAQVDDAFMHFEVKNPSSGAIDVLKGFELHIKELSLQYDNKIKIITEV